jgi:hypothetical protein
MSSLVIDKKEYVVILKKEYDSLRENAARKATPVNKLSLKEGKKLAYSLIDSWAKEN